MIVTSQTTVNLEGVRGTAQGARAGNTATAGLFAGYLDAQMAGAAASRGASESSQEGEENSELTAIKEKGLVAYMMEYHAKRVREEILKSMNLTEEALAKMSPEQRAAVEKIIAEETQKKLAAEALTQKGEGKKQDTMRLEEIASGKSFGAIATMEKILAAGCSDARQEDEDR